MAVRVIGPANELVPAMLSIAPARPAAPAPAIDNGLVLATTAVLNPNVPPVVHAGLGLALAGLGKNDDAIQSLEWAVKREPNARGRPTGIHIVDGWVAGHYRLAERHGYYDVLVPCGS